MEGKAVIFIVPNGWVYGALLFAMQYIPCCTLYCG